MKERFVAVSRELCIFSLIVATALVITAVFTIQIWDRPFIGTGDTDTYEHVAYQFSRILRWVPYPQLDFSSNLVGYPYKINTVAQSWLLERDYFYSLVRPLFGQGPWYQIYIGVSLLISVIGIFLLLRNPFGTANAGLVSFLATFFNFCGLHKFPHHASLVSIHWTVINIAADLVMCRAVFNGQVLGLRFLLLRALLLVLALGHEMGYIAGFALTSFTLSFIYCIAVFFRRKRLEIDFKREWKLYSLQIVGLCIGIAGLTFLYLPIYLQILSLFSEFPKTSSGTFWTNPIRFIIPWFPFFNPSHPFFEKIGDYAEGMSPGWTLLILSGIGLRSIFQRRLTYYLPLCIFLLLGLFFHPVLFPSLKVFPWFSQMRSTGRLSLILPLMMGLFFLASRENKTRYDFRSRLFIVVALLGFVEYFTAQILLPSSQVIRPSDSFLTYMDTVKKSPGSAVLDWPLCLHGGNRVPEGYCPFELQMMHTGALQKFHEKKVVNFYLGRLNPKIVEPFATAGWRALLTSLPARKKDGPCFEKGESEFFSDFFLMNDFGGINLYVDRLPKSCEEEFRKRWGSPVAETQIPSAGRVLYFVRPEREWAKVDLSRAKGLRFVPSLESLNVDLVAEENPPNGIELDAIGPTRYVNQRKVRPLSRGSASFIFFPSSRRQFTIKFSMESRLRGQFCKVAFGGTLLGESSLSESNPWEVERTIQADAGKNDLVVECVKSGDWRDIFDLYKNRYGLLGFMNFIRLQNFYKEYRHEPAYFRTLQLMEQNVVVGSS